MTATLETLPLQGPRFGQRLRTAHKSRDMTQKELAAAAGISVMSVRSYEHGRRSPSDGTLIAMDGVLSRRPVRHGWGPAPEPIGERARNANHADAVSQAMSAMPEEAATLVALFAKFVLHGEAAFAGMRAGT